MEYRLLMLSEYSAILTLFGAFLPIVWNKFVYAFDNQRILEKFKAKGKVLSLECKA